MKTFQQTRDVLENSIDFHMRTSSLYAELSQKTVDPRAKLLLNYMSIHENELVDNQKRFNKDASKRIMDTWLQFTAEQSNQSFFNDLLTGSRDEIDMSKIYMYLSQLPTLKSSNTDNIEIEIENTEIVLKIIHSIIIFFSTVPSS